MSIINLLSRLGDKAGAVGSLVSVMACPMCFPAMASLGAALGIGFLSQWESLFVFTLLPIFAAIALFASALGWFSHHQWHRSVLGMLGPVLVLLALYPLFKSEWMRTILYTGLAVMVLTSLWDIFSPVNKRCNTGQCEVKS